jgi:membrane-bound metal-dependent hydrolase YbcI (DUF457 family)
MLDTVFGLPTHALVIHAVVVLLPLAAAGAVIVALVPRLRGAYGWLVVAAAAASAASVPIATHSGQYLYNRLTPGFGPRQAREAELLEHHRTLAHQLWPWSVLLLVGILAVMLLHRRSASWAKPAGYAAIAVTLVGAVVSAIMVIRIGHAGSQALWNGVTGPK